MHDTPPLQGRTAIVTGASSGIGRATAEQLAQAGAHVFLAGRTTSALEELNRRISQEGGKSTVATVDLRDTDQTMELIARAVSETERLDIMVNNAGLEFPASIIDGRVEDWRSMLETNVLALLVGCQAAIKAMRACAADGHVVNISSVSAQRPNSGVYGATKHAVNTISASLRDELEEDTIRVTNVMPGATSTNFARNFPEAFVERIIDMSGMEVAFEPGQHLPAETLEALSENLNQMLCSPSDVARAVLFAVTQPINVNIADIVVRPPRAMTLPH
jgi:NADP-dependent 3-hydroxy acid dehydrogenase YdfG